MNEMKPLRKTGTPIRAAQDNTAGKSRSVAELVRSLADDTEFADDLAARIQGRQFVKALAVARNCAGLSQKDLADKMGCNQPKISKIENGADADVAFGDLAAYAAACGRELRIAILPTGMTLADEVQYHAAIIRGLLHRAARPTGDDGAAASGVAGFLEAAAANLAKLTESAAGLLPDGPQQPARPVTVDAPSANGTPPRPARGKRMALAG